MRKATVHKGTALLLLSWLCFVAIPAVNAQHHDSGQQWIRLCTSAGIVLVAVEDNQPPTLDDHGTHCPCVQAMVLPMGSAAPTQAVGRSVLNTSAQPGMAPDSHFAPYRSRAPPISLS
ncbi:MAG: hypothetical protein ACX931_05955 [Saccharospirillum sp.]